MTKICNFLTIKRVTLFLIFVEAAVLLLAITLAGILISDSPIYMLCPILYSIESLTTTVVLGLAGFIARFRVRLVKGLYVLRVAFTAIHITFFVILLVVLKDTLLAILLLSGFIAITLIYRLFFTILLSSIIYNTNTTPS